METNPVVPLGVATPVDMAERADRAWACLRDNAKSLSADSPRKGKRVLIEGGRKHKGKTGTVFYHGPDRFNPPGRYCGNGLQKAMYQILGVYGYRIGVETDSGEMFFCPAEYARVIQVG